MQAAEHETLDGVGRARLRDALDHDEVAAAYLFGSQARNAAGPLSDVDVGVWASPLLDARQRFDLRIELARNVREALRTGAVDLVVLDDSSPLLRHRAWRDGELVLDRDPRTRVRGEARALVEYLDTKPLREQTAAGVSHRLAEGRLVDADSVFSKLGRLDSLLTVLADVRARGERAVVSDVHVQLEAERGLQVSIQICIDLGAHLISELGLKPPEDYRSVFASLAQAGVIEPDLAEQLTDAAGLRNLLVHDYGEIDHQRLWATLGELDDLRDFAKAVEAIAREG
ncbi:MAG: type VII toxin-antitoxin system HepT family RNase toxin [Thermoleophilaceae bacterium]